MSITDAIKNFTTQLSYEPEISNREKLGAHDVFVVVGMGGSHLAADLVKMWKPSVALGIHQGYGLPSLPQGVLERSLVIASSYSGNTEEVIEAFEEAGKRNLARAAISVGGKLLELAAGAGVPYMRLPDTGIQPRAAVGFMMQALFALMRQEEGLRETQELAKRFRPTEYEGAGRELAGRLGGRIPVIYAALRNAAIAVNWKVRFNETAKIPAFWNTFPELNHNEMTGFDMKEKTKDLSERFSFIFLKDPDDPPKIQKRMEVTERLLRDRGFPVEVVALKGETALEKIFASLILCDWTAYYTAEGYGVESEEVPMVEEFKKLVA